MGSHVTFTSSDKEQYSGGPERGEGNVHIIQSTVSKSVGDCRENDSHSSKLIKYVIPGGRKKLGAETQKVGIYIGVKDLEKK